MTHELPAKESSGISSEHTGKSLGKAHKKSIEDKAMSLFDHLDELRSRLIKSALAVLGLFGACLFFSTEIIQFLKQPLVYAVPNKLQELHFTGPMDVFSVSLKVSLMTAVVFACPVWIYQFWRFVEPALYEHERRYIGPFIIASIGLFVSGVAFCYYLIFPWTLQFLIGLGLEVGTPMITITDYMSIMLLMLFGFGIVFEAPLILVLLAVLELIDSAFLIEYRKIMIIVILVIAAIFTPPDPLSQIGMAIPLYGMYEFAILVIKHVVERNKQVNA